MWWRSDRVGGALTGLLIDRFDAFTAIEIDERAVAWLRERWAGMDIRCGDVLDVDWRALARERGKPIFIVGNLPYHVTTPILFSLLDAREAIRESVVMVQLEVGERLVAKPRTKAYGILSVLWQTFAVPALLFRVSPGAFVPRPRVTSALVRLGMRPGDGLLQDVQEDFFRRVVRTAFNQRRKTLRNSLARCTRPMGVALPDEIGSRRPEELTPEEFVALARYLWART